MIQSFLNLIKKQKKDQQTAQRLLNQKKIPFVSEINSLSQKAQTDTKAQPIKKEDPITPPQIYYPEAGNNTNIISQVKFPNTELKAGGNIRQEKINFYKQEIENEKKELENKGLWELVKSYPRKIIGGTDYERLAIAKNKLNQLEQEQKVGIGSSLAQGYTNKTAIPIVGDIIQAGRNIVKRNAFKKRSDGKELDSLENILLLEDEIDLITPKSTGYQVSEGVQQTLRFIGDLILAKRIGKVPNAPNPIHSVKDMTVVNTLKNTAHYLKHAPKVAVITPFTYSEISNRLAPHYKEIAGKTFLKEGQGYKEAIITGYVSSLATIATEGLGELFNPAFKLASPLKQYLSPKFIREWIENIPKSKTTEVIQKIREGASIQGFIPEMAEEVLDGFIQSYINNDPQNRFMSKEEFKNTAYVIGILRALGLSGQIKDIMTEGAGEVGQVLDEAFTDYRQGEGLFLEGEMDKIMGGDKETGEGKSIQEKSDEIIENLEKTSFRGQKTNLKNKDYVLETKPISQMSEWEAKTKGDQPRIDEMKKAIQSNAEIPPVIGWEVDGKFMIFDGHHRVEAYKELGIENIPILIQQKGKGTGKILNIEKVEAKTSPLQDDIDRSKLINLPEGKKSVSTSPAEIQQTDIQGGETTLAQLQEQKRRSEERAELQKLQAEKSGKIRGEMPTYQADLFNGQETDQNLFTQQANKEIRSDIQRVENKLDKLIQTRSELSQKLYKAKENYNPFDSDPEQESVMQRLEERIKEITSQINRERYGGSYLERYTDEENEAIQKSGIKNPQELLDNDEIEEKLKDLQKQGVKIEDVLSMYSQQDEQNIDEYINDLHEYYYGTLEEAKEEVSQNEMPEVKGLAQGLADWVEYNKLFLSKALGIGKTAPKKEEIYDFFSGKDWASFIKIANEKKKKTKLTNDFLEKFSRLDSSASEASSEDGVNVSADEIWDMMIDELNSGEATKRVSLERRRLAQKTKQARKTDKQEKGQLPFDSSTKPSKIKSDDSTSRQNTSKNTKGEIVPQGGSGNAKKQSAQIVATKTRKNKGEVSKNIPNKSYNKQEPQYELGGRGYIQKKTSKRLDKRHDKTRPRKGELNKLAKNQTLEVEEKTFNMKEVRLLKERIRNFARGVRAGRSDVQKELTEVKKEIAKFARESLPTTDFRKSETTYLLSRVAEAKNEKDIRNAFDRILKIAEDSKKRVLTNKIIKELKNTKVKTKNGIPQGKFTPDTQEALEKMKAIVGMSKEDAQEKIVQNLSAMDTTTDLNQDELLMENELLNYADIKNMKSEELAETLNFIKFLKASGRHEKKQKIEARKKRLETIREGVSESITGGREAPKVAVGTKEYDKKPIRDTVRGWDDSFQGWVTLLDKLSRFDKSSKPLQSKLNIFGENIFHARNGKNMMIMDLQAKVQQKGKELFGTHRKFRKALNKSFEDREIGTFKDESGETVLLKMNEQEALDFYLMSKDSDNMMKIMEDNQYTQEMIDAIEDSITPKMLEYGQFMQSLTEKIKEKVAPIYEDLYGIKFPDNPDYWPRTVDFESMKKDSLMLLEEQSKTSTDPSAVKSRTKHKRPLKFENATMKFMRHIDQMSHFVNFAKPMKDIRSVFGNEEIRKQIKTFHGQTAMRQLDDMINDLAVDRATQGKTYKMLDELRKRFTTASTGLNLNVFVKQLTSFPAYAGDVPLKDFTTEALGFWTNPVKNFKTLMESSDLMKARYTMGFERDLRDAMQTTAIQKATNGKSLVDLAMFLVKNGDKFAIVNGGWAKYRYEYKKYIRSGKTKEQAHKRAIEEFEKATKLSQQASDIEDLGELQRSGSLGKIFTMFQTSPIAYYRQTGVALRGFLNKRGFTAMSEEEAEAFRDITRGENIEENIKILERELSKGRKEVSTGQKIATQSEYAKRFLIYWVVLPSVFQYVADGFEWEEDNQARAMILGAFNYIPAFGNAIQTISGKIAGDRWDWDPIPIVSAINSIGDLFKKVPDIKKHIAGEEVMKGSSINSAVNDFLQISGTATGFPFKPAYTTLSGAKELYTGETGDFRRLIQSEYSIFDGKTEVETIKDRSYLEKLSKKDAERWFKEQKRLRDRGEISLKTFKSRINDMSTRQKEAPILQKYAKRAEKILNAPQEKRRAVYEAMRVKHGFTDDQFSKAGLKRLFNEFYE